MSVPMPVVQKTARFLVIDDDPSMSTLVQGLIPNSVASVTAAMTIQDGVRLASERQFDVVILDHLLPDGLGLELIPRLVAQDRLRPILYITAQSGAHTAIEAIKSGAFDYLSKPINFSLLKKRLIEAIEYRNLMRLPVVVDGEAATNLKNDVLVGRCQAMQEVFKNIGRLANLFEAVLIEGEVGTGKEMIARAIHAYGERQQSDFLKISGEALGESLAKMDSYSLTNCFPQARGGTIFIEEIASLSSSLQTKLLSVIQPIDRPSLGETRVIVSTSVPSRQLLERGILRSDLYYFLSPYTVRVPSLRERGDDFELLVAHFMQRLTSVSATNREGGPPRVSASALSLLRGHDWPGNVAQLKSVLQTALHESRGAVLASAALRQALDGSHSVADETEDGVELHGEVDKWDLAQFVQRRLSSETHQLYDDAVAELDRSLLTLVLRHTRGNQAQAAKLLGMTRTSLRKKIIVSKINLSRLFASEANELGPSG
jgi:DNA-binding NtrC family response regulator